MTVLLLRDLKILFRNPRAWFLSLVFFLLFISLFAIAMTGDPKRLQSVAAPAIWLAVIFSLLLSFDGLFEQDIRTGVFEQLKLSGVSMMAIVVSKTLTTFFVTGLPLICILPLASILLGLDPITASAIIISVLVGLPALLALGIMSAAILSGSKNAGFLTSLLTIPFFVPIVIFAISGIKDFPSNGIWNTGFVSVLGISLISIAICLPAAAAALNTNLE